MIKEWNASKLLSLCIILLALFYYQTVVGARTRLTAERALAIEQVETYNAAMQPTAQPDGGSLWKDGTFEGSGQGFGGAIRVSVTVAGGKLTAVNVLDAAGEDKAYLELAQALPQSIVKAQSAQVDAVSGATFSSNGILEAAQSALGKAEA